MKEKLKWLLILSCLFLFNLSCEKNDIVKPTTKPTTKIEIGSASATPVSIILSGRIVELVENEKYLDYGFCFSSVTYPTIRNNRVSKGIPILGEFTDTIEGLNPGKYYNYRVYCISAKDTLYGEIKTIKTLENGPAGKITDVDGNVYNVVSIGGVLWMKENLRTTKLNDGTEIPLETSDSIWYYSTAPAYCWPNNDIANLPSYGALYNYYAVLTNKLCPTGWHVARQEEFLSLPGLYENPLVLRSTWGWTDGYVGTDNYGFSAMPAGVRSGSYSGFGRYCFFWIPDYPNFVHRRGLVFSIYKNMAGILGSGESMSSGLSVRCVKDQNE